MSKKELDSLFFKQDSSRKTPSPYGRVSNALGKIISYDRTPELFDTQEIIQRDKELIELQTQDEVLCIDRKGKPVCLTTRENQMLCALTRYLNVEDEDIRIKMQDPFPKRRNSNIQISRAVSISELSQLFFGSKRERCREDIKRILNSLSEKKHMQIIDKEIDEKGRRFRIVAPFIHLDLSIEELNPQDEEEALDAITIIYGGAFFYELNKRYFYVTPRCFEVWRKQKYQSELFSTLLMHLLSIYWQFYTASQNAEARVKKIIRKENTDSKTRTPKEDYVKRIREEKKNALTYRINFSSIKAKIGRDYDSEKQYKSAFKKDLKTAMEGLIETGLITEYQIIKGAKKQEILVIVFSENYNQFSKLLS